MSWNESIDNKSPRFSAKLTAEHNIRLVLVYDHGTTLYIHSFIIVYIYDCVHLVRMLIRSYIINPITLPISGLR